MCTSPSGGIQDPRVKGLLPDPVVYAQVGGLLHRVHGESFLRLPGLMNFGGMEFVIDYLTSTRIEPSGKRGQPGWSG